MVSGKIIKGVGGLYTVDTPQGIYACRARGIFRKRNVTPLVGDIVDITILDEREKEGTIEVIHPRRTELIRPRIANVDHAVLLFSAVAPDLNRDLLDRFIILCEMENLDITICIHKTDTIDIKAYEDFRQMYVNVGYYVIFTSAVDNSGAKELEDRLAGRVSVFAGPSGAGKSSMVNVLIPTAQLPVGALSEKIARGKHTTRHTQLLRMGENTFVADTPGFTSLYIDKIQRDDLDQYFREFKPYLNQCRFADCSHIDEPDCGVKAALSQGKIHENRYSRYCSIYRELER